MNSNAPEFEDIHVEESKLVRDTYVYITNTVKTAAKSMFPIRNFSAYQKVIRIATYVLLFLKHSARKIKGRQSIFNLLAPSTNSAGITAEFMNKAETTVIKTESTHMSIIDIRKIFKGRNIERDGEGIIRYRSRLQNAEINYDTINLIFIPSASPLAKLIINDTHVKYGHCGK
uniref:Uncharacterized protein n=1 Tax=Heterorhabditis bacteriophora TaxID=37862 RepID=A0A1I7WI28_HETBA